MFNTKQLIADALLAVENKDWEAVIDLAAQLLDDRDALKSAAADHGMSAGDFAAATSAGKVEAALWYDDSEGSLPNNVYAAINAARGL